MTDQVNQAQKVPGHQLEALLGFYSRVTAVTEPNAALLALVIQELIEARFMLGQDVDGNG
jgi:hypothetical protein